MTNVLNQHYFKTIGLPDVTSTSETSGDLTISGSNLKLNTGDQRLVLHFDDAGDVVVDGDSGLLTTNTDASLVLDLDDYSGDSLESMTLESVGSYSVDFDVDPDEVIT